MAPSWILFVALAPHPESTERVPQLINLSKSWYCTSGTTEEAQKEIEGVLAEFALFGQQSSRKILP